jgi:SCP-2 sterol transfer family protein
MEAEAGGAQSVQAEPTVPGLGGLRGRLLIEVGGNPKASLVIRDGAIDLVPGDGAADARILVRDESTFGKLLSGHLNPVVAGLQGEVDVVGDRALAVAVLLKLQGRPLRAEGAGEK